MVNHDTTFAECYVKLIITDDLKRRLVDSALGVSMA